VLAGLVAELSLMQPELELEPGQVQPPEPVHWAGSATLLEQAQAQPLLGRAP
jgi:hypothetical protein